MGLGLAREGWDGMRVRIEGSDFSGELISLTPRVLPNDSITTHREGETPRTQRQEKNYKEHKLPCTMYTPQGVCVCVWGGGGGGGGGEGVSNLIPRPSHCCLEAFSDSSCCKRQVIKNWSHAGKACG